MLHTPAPNQVLHDDSLTSVELPKRAASNAVNVMRIKAIVVENFIVAVVVVLLLLESWKYERCEKCLGSDCEPNNM
jgi:hypothetical protein